MDTNLTLILTASAMFGCGVYLVLERSLTRVLVGLVLLSNGVNLLLLASGGAAGEPPLLGEAAPSEMTDPLPQALVLTAIVITLATVAFVLAMAHRSWQLHGHDDVQDDVEDAVIRRRAAADEASDTYDLSTSGQDEEVYEEEGS